MIINRTFDANLIDGILNHKSIKPHIGDDSTTSKDIYYPIKDHLIYLTTECKSLLFVGFPVNSYTLDAHTAVLPELRGKQAVKAGKAAIDWVFNNTKYIKIVGATPSDNKLAMRFNRLIGLNREGVCKESIVRGGRLIDRIYYGVERKRWESKQQY